ncbi:MAG: sugar ABC transporter substrate-binding protein [Candidatus Atribacteria bacterium]|nr:sugar ABC transporter substrate-binding protein [Candidatus Atribacteria bacterium]
MMVKLRNFILIFAIFVIAFSSIVVGAQENKQLTVGYVIPYEIGWFSSFVQGFELVAQVEGVKTVRLHHNYKADEETKAVENLITMGVDGINVTAATPESAEYSCRLANEAGIPIQVTESGVAEGKGKPLADIDFNWNEIYRFIARNLRNDIEGPISIINIQGFAGSPPVMQGIAGFKDEISKLEDMKLATDIQFGDYATDKSLSVMKTLIQSGLEFNVAIGSCQEITEGIIQALKEENVPRDKVVVVSVNGGPMDVENLKKGNIDYCLSQSPGLHGMICAANLIAMLKGQTYQKKTYSPVVWVNQKTWEAELIPWDMDDSWLPVVQEFIKTGQYKPELRAR